MTLNRKINVLCHQSIINKGHEFFYKKKKPTKRNNFLKIESKQRNKEIKMNCLNCKKYIIDKDKCEIYGEIIAVLCCKDFKKIATPTAVGGCPSRAKKLIKKKRKQHEKAIAQTKKNNSKQKNKRKG